MKAWQRTYLALKITAAMPSVTLNKTLDNIIDYSLSGYTWYVDSLKGYAYATDVPGAVKNVSSLNPLETGHRAGRCKHV